MTTTHTTLNFPEIRLHQRDGHKLRGYFARQFGEESDLFHNHEKDGRAIYRYPRIQFKVVSGSPVVVGIAEGAQMLVQRFLDIKELDIEGETYTLHHKHLQSGEVEVGVRNALYEYQFVTPWMALNQENYKQWLNMDERKRQDKLERILKGNILSFFSALDYFEQQQIMLHIHMEAVPTTFKNQRMTAFKGKFVTNVQLPDYIGLGKSVSRGYGTVVRVLGN